MEDFFIAATKETPEVSINISEGTFKIKGRTLSEDSVAFFTPIFKQTEEYFKSPQDKTTFIFSFEYLNSSSLKLVIDLLVFSKKLLTGNNSILIKWYYEADDDDILMLGEETARLTGLPFEYHPY
jgi:hypothetical protein